MLLGDMNARSPVWDNSAGICNEKGLIFEQLLLEYPISLLNNFLPTHYHIQTNTYTVIDLSIISSNSLLDFDYSVSETLHSSDHDPIIIKLKNNENMLPERPNLYNTNKANWTLFYTLTETNINIDEVGNVDEAVSAVKEVICGAANASIPKKSTNFKKPPVPWWNDKVAEARNHRRRAERTLRRRFSIENKIAYNRARAKSRYIMNKSKKETWQKYISSINQHTSLHNIWKKVQKIAGKFSPHSSPVLKDVDGEMITNKLEVANILASNFTKISKKENYPDHFQRHMRESEKNLLHFNTRQDLYYNRPITHKEFNSALSLCSESSPGEDTITYSMIKHSHHTLKQQLLKLYNKILTKGQFPSEWSSAIIIPIPKPGKDHTDCNNYRPISLTNTLCKLLEKIINCRLMWFLETNNLINKLQFGFRRNRSTVDNLIILENEIQQSLSSRNHFIAIFCDIQTQYDTAWKYGILEKLQQYGLRGNIPIFIRGFISNRKIKVRIGNSMSAEFDVEEGIPQGSVLSCTMFMIAMNNVNEYIPRNINYSIYVDDLTIYSSGSTTGLIERRLQLGKSRLQEWCRKTGFSFSIDKTCSLHICRKQNCPKLAPNLKLNNINVKNFEEKKYLGLIFDKSFTWKPHITKLRKQGNKTLDLLKHLSHQSWGADRQSLLNLYLMLLKPVIDYGIEIYSSTAKTYMNSVSSLQNGAIRVATGAFRSSPIPSIHADSGILPMKFYNERKILNTFLRIACNPSHPLYLTALDEDYNPCEKSFFTRARKLLIEYDIDVNGVMTEETLNAHPWGKNGVTSCREMHQYKKSDTTNNELRHRFNEHFKTHENDLCIFTDGSKTDTGVGYALVTEGEKISRRIENHSSIHTAELLAISSAINFAIQNTNNHIITIATDSRSSIDAILKFNNNNPIVVQINNKLSSCNRQLNICWAPSHVGISLNEAADKAAKEASMHGEIWPTLLPRCDFKKLVESKSRRRWATIWRNIPPESNKLRRHKDFIAPYKITNFSDRHWERTLCRVRIGHTRLTHNFLMEGTGQPYCEYCIVPLSIYHIVLECPNYEDERQIFENTINLSAIFERQRRTRRIMDFFKKHKYT